MLALTASAGTGQNLVADGGFASDFNAWHHDLVASGSSTWSSQDAAGSASSGSALLMSTHPTVYGATVDNTTNDPSAQWMPYLSATT
jgi:hypothetical protein